jgi:nitroreductase
MDVLEAIRIRRSVRKYRDDPIPDDVLDRMLEAIRLAPSACNYQPWRFVVVRDKQTREALGEASCKQHFIAQAPAIIVGCGFPDKAYKKMGGYGNSVDIDLAIALDHLTLAAAAKGLGTVWIGAFDEEAVKRILGVPADVKVVALTPLGYPAEPGMLRAAEANKRNSREQVFGFDTF